eukprot:363727-Chlamydomonas_euryale.AAC.6
MTVLGARQCWEPGIGGSPTVVGARQWWEPGSGGTLTVVGAAPGRARLLLGSGGNRSGPRRPGP